MPNEKAEKNGMGERHMTETVNLSFSYKVKEELSLHFGNARHCHIAELAAFVNLCGEIGQFQDGFCIKIRTENLLVAKKCFTLLKNTFNIRVDISVRTGSKKRRSYLLLVRFGARCGEDTDGDRRFTYG